jgi:Fe-S-cluster containining protein
MCREDCGACCVAPSINGPLPGMPAGKPAGVRCLHLDGQQRCALFDDPRRPALCAAFAPEPAICGDSREQAMQLIGALEVASRPGECMG